MKPLVSTLNLGFTLLEFHETYVISRLSEGSIVEEEQFQKLVEVCKNFYRNTFFVYVSHRVNNININPTVYLQLRQAQLLSGFAVVSSNPPDLNMALFEKRFSSLPFEIFIDLEDAVEWAGELVRNKKADL